ncbi:MAG: hypothetical protein GY895_03715 [Phycisphaera sp.]|nr:hypothetical protein [Phycisphaera sp.]
MLTAPGLFPASGNACLGDRRPDPVIPGGGFSPIGSGTLRCRGCRRFRRGRDGQDWGRGTPAPAGEQDPEIRTSRQSIAVQVAGHHGRTEATVPEDGHRVIDLAHECKVEIIVPIGVEQADLPRTVPGHERLGR